MFLATAAGADEKQGTVFDRKKDAAKVEVRLVSPEAAKGYSKLADPDGKQIFVSPATDGIELIVVKAELVNPPKDAKEGDKSWSLKTKLDEESGKRFAALTGKQANKRIAIVIDGKVLCAPVVREEIKGGELHVTGNYDKAEAENLARKITGNPVP